MLFCIFILHIDVNIDLLKQAINPRGVSPSNPIEFVGTLTSWPFIPFNQSKASPPSVSPQVPATVKKSYRKCPFNIVFNMIYLMFFLLHFDVQVQLSCADDTFLVSTLSDQYADKMSRKANSIFSSLGWSVTGLFVARQDCAFCHVLEGYAPFPKYRFHVFG